MLAATHQESSAGLSDNDEMGIEREENCLSSLFTRLTRQEGEYMVNIQGGCEDLANPYDLVFLKDEHEDVTFLEGFWHFIFTRSEGSPKSLSSNIFTSPRRLPSA